MPNVPAEQNQHPDEHSDSCNCASCQARDVQQDSDAREDSLERKRRRDGW